MISFNLKVNGVFWFERTSFYLPQFNYLKIDELRNITKLFNAAVIEINESKLDDSTLLSGIHIDNCIHFAVIETDMGER